MTFAAQVGEWVTKVKTAQHLIFQQSVQDLVSELNALVPVDTGFLRASLVGSTVAMPSLSRPNPNRNAVYTIDSQQIELVILGTEPGDTIYLGYTANYGAHVHYGANGRAGRPWVEMVAQRWETIVKTNEEKVRSQLGL